MTLPGGGTVDPGTGGVTPDEGGSVVIDTGDGTTTITPPSGQPVTPNDDGSVTIPGGSTVTTGDGESITIPPEGGTIQPGGDVEYLVTVTFDSQGGSEVASQTVTVGTVLTRPADPTRSGYSFQGWYTTADGDTEWNFDNPVPEDMTLYAHWSRNSSGGGGGSSSPTYRPDIEDTENGSVTVSPRNPERGDTVTITPDPDPGYEVDEVIVTDRDGDEVEVTERRDGTYTFIQPTGRVTIEVTFVPVTEEPTTPAAPSDWANPYTDVAANAWYYDAVAYVTANGLMNGTSATTFAPDATTTRAMIWTVLARMNGQSVDGGTPWYALAQSWAMRANVSDGTNPESAISREELATMLYRAAGSPAVSGNLLSYPDGNAVSAWAENALLWATQNGIISGIDGMLTPQGQATRAQVAAMLMRFREAI